MTVKKKTHEQFIKEIRELVGDEYVFIDRYINKKTKLTVRHDSCGYEWSVRPSDFLQGTRCPECSRKRMALGKLLGNDEFQQRINIILGNEFEVGEYINKRTKVHLKHKQCGYEWDALPGNVYRLKGCPKCLGHKHDINTEDFKKQVKDLVGDEYTVFGQYKGARCKITMKHNKCGNEYSVSPPNFMRGTRCPACAVIDKIERLRKEGYDFSSKMKGKSKYNINIGDIYGHWLVIETNVHTKEGKDKSRDAYNNAMCLCTKCNINKKVLSYSRLVKTEDSKMCMECAGFLPKTTEQYIGQLAEKNPLAKLKDDQIYTNNNTKLIHICSMCNSEFEMTPDAAFRGQNTCRSCAYEKVANKRTWSHDEYVKTLATVNPFVKLKEGQIYAGSNNKLIHICSRCGRDWSISPVHALNGHVMCRNCARGFFESTHATLIKQVYKHHYKEAVWEEHIKINDNEYDIDIVNHKRMEAIEIDGVQHKKITNWHKRQAERIGTTPESVLEKQVRRDEKVNQYFKELGYKLIRIDIEKISPLEALQQVFPQYERIPEWIDFSGKITKNTWDINKAQELLNQNVPMAEIARILGIFQSVITLALKNGRLIKPKGYVVLNERSWDLVKAQELLNQYRTYKEICDELNITIGSLSYALYTKKLIKPKDYKKEKDVKFSLSEAQKFLDSGLSYKKVAKKLMVTAAVISRQVRNGNLKRPDNSQGSKKAVVQLDLSGNIVVEYESLSSVDGYGSFNSISNACLGKYGRKIKGHIYKNYIWYYKLDYDKLK